MRILLRTIRALSLPVQGYIDFYLRFSACICVRTQHLASSIFDKQRAHATVRPEANYACVYHSAALTTGKGVVSALRVAAIAGCKIAVRATELFAKLNRGLDKIPASEVAIKVKIKQT